MSGRYDVVIVGGGHNALTAAAYLSKAGRSVVVLEKAETVGGVAATREFAPGFRSSAAFQSAETFSPRVAKELGLPSHGLELLPAAGVSVAAESGWLSFDGRGRAQGDGAAGDEAAALKSLEKELGDLVGVLTSMYEAPLPELESLGAADKMDLLRTGWRLRKLGRKKMQGAMRTLPMSMRDFVEERLTTDAARALVAGLGSSGAAPGPFAAGTLFRALHDQLSNPRPLFSGPAGVRGGMGALAAALKSAAEAAGAEVRCGAEVTSIDVDAGAVRGVTLASGDHIEAGMVLSGLGATTTLRGLVDAASITPEFAFAANNVRARGGVALISFALDGLPETPAGATAEALGGRIQLTTTVADIERGFDDAPAGRLPRHPFVQLSFPSLSDDSLVDGDGHVATAWVQAVPRVIRGGEGDGWDAGREALARAVTDHIDSVIPGFSDRITAHEVAAPPDFESRLGVEDGCLFGADISLDQALYLRPIAGWYSYRMPVAGLYLCGSCTHGGGGITGLAGRNAATLAAADARKGRG